MSQRPSAGPRGRTPRTAGNRVSRTSGGAKTWFAYDFRQTNGFDGVIAEYNSSGGLLARYVQGPWVDEPLAMIRTDAFFYSYDALGSATRLTTTAQATNALYRYEAFGSARDSVPEAQNPYRFTGREWDTPAGLQFNRARWYDPGIGRFLSVDPSGMVDGPNLYLYVRNNPTTLVDPDALMIVQDGGGVPPQPSKCDWWNVHEQFGAVLRTIPLGNHCPAYIVSWGFGLLNDEYSHLPGGTNNDKFAHCWVSCALVKSCGISATQTAIAGVVLEIIQGMRGDWIADVEADLRGIYCLRYTTWSCCACCQFFYGVP